MKEAYERVRAETKRVKQKMKENWDKGKKDNPFKLNDIVWYKIGKKTKEENRKLSAKFSGPYKIFNIPDGEHHLNVDIVHTNNPNDKHRVSVRQLKIAKLKPEQLGEISEVSIPIKEAPAVVDKESENTTAVSNPKGRNIFTQAKRKGLEKRIALDKSKEYEVEDIVA